MTVNAYAYLSGSFLKPHVVLDFPRGSSVLDVVRGLPERSFDPETKKWTVGSFGTNPDKVCASAGIYIVGADGNLTSLNPYVTPVATANRDHDTYTAVVHPRLTCVDDIRGWLGPDALWKPEERVFWCRPSDLGDWAWVMEELPEPKSAAPPDVPGGASAVSPPVAGGPADRFLFDGTVDGLRGVPLTDLRSVSDDVASGMVAMGVENVHDLLWTVPRRFIDLSNPTLIADAEVGEDVAVVAKVEKVDMPREAGGMAKATLVDAAGTKLYVRWFKAGWALKKKVHEGARLIVHGKFEEFHTMSGFHGFAMTNPITDPIAKDANKGLIGVYPASGKHDVTTWAMYRAASEAAKRIGSLTDPFAAQAASHGLLGRAAAFRAVHNPMTPEDFRAGRERLAFDELMRLQTALAVARAEQYNTPAVQNVSDGFIIGQYLKSLPFAPTGAQARACDAILKRVATTHAMNAVLNGDVGSGKSLVSVVALLAAVEAGHQAVMVAPTDTLVEQHYADVAKACEGLVKRDGSPVVAMMLKGSMTRKHDGMTRKEVLGKVAAGEVDIVVGTGAVFQDTFTPPALGVVVIDEQHRFGVEQREALRTKGADGCLPDVLYATATMIPRTALMTEFGDMDMFVLDELPPGRTPIVTTHIQTADTHDASNPAWMAVREQVAQGRQAFVVCPLVSDSKTKEAAAAVETAQELMDGALSGMHIGVVTGKMPPAERNQVMSDFKDGKYEALVATTVIEVGVNVPNATVMVVLGADRFGISQLHQVRGRVGRGEFPGQCWLVANTENARGTSSQERMDAMCASTDGLLLAEADLKTRGAGRLTGSKQSGRVTDLRVANIMEDRNLIAWAKADSNALVSNDPRLARSPMLHAEMVNALGKDAGAWLTRG